MMRTEPSRPREITLPEGSPSDDGSVETVHGLSNRKNALVLEHIRSDGVDVFPFEGGLIARKDVYTTAHAARVLP